MYYFFFLNVMWQENCIIEIRPFLTIMNVWMFFKLYEIFFRSLWKGKFGSSQIKYPNI